MKTNTQHTPGPWNYSASHPRITKHVFGGYIIPDVCEVETEENARLIASAPELLAALQIIHANAGESPEWIRRHTSAAIAKATGGQS